MLSGEERMLNGLISKLKSSNRSFTKR